MLNMENLRNEYLATIPKKIMQIQYLLSCVVESRKVDSSLLELHRIIHNFSGCCEIYELKGVRDLCLIVEKDLSCMIEKNRLDKKSLNRLCDLMGKLTSCLKKNVPKGI